MHFRSFFDAKELSEADFQSKKILVLQYNIISDCTKMKDKIGVNVLKDPSNDIVGVIKMPPRSLLTPCTCVKHHFAPFPGDTWLHYFYTFIQSHFVSLVQLFPLFLLPILSLVEACGWEARGSAPCTLSQAMYPVSAPR